MVSRSGKPQQQISRRRAVIWGMTLGYSGLLLTITRNILLVPVYLHYVSLAEYGAWLASGALLAQWLITDFGLSGVLMQRCAALHGAGESSRLATVIGSGLLAGLVLAATLSLLAVSAIPLLPQMPGLNAAEGVRVSHCMYLAVAAAALGVVGAISQGLVRSLQHAAAAGSVTLAAELAGIAATLAGLFLHAGLIALAWGLLARSLFVVCVQTGYLLLRACRELAVLRAPDLPVIRELFVDGWVSFVSSLAMKTPTQANTLLIGYTLGSTSAATYGLTVRAHDAALLFLSQINGSLAPSMAHLWGTGNRERFNTLINRIAMVGALAGGACMAVLVSANAGFVGLWVHDRAFAGQAVSVLMAAVVWVSATGSVAYDSLYAIGRFRAIAGTFIVTAVVHITLLAVLLRYGVWAAPAASLASTALWTVAFWGQLQRQTSLPTIQVKRTLTDFALSGVCGAITGALILDLAPRATSGIGIAATAACAALATAGLILLSAPWIRTAVLTEIATTARTLQARHRTSS